MAVRNRDAPVAFERPPWAARGDPREPASRKGAVRNSSRRCMETSTGRWAARLKPETGVSLFQRWRWINPRVTALPITPPLEGKVAIVLHATVGAPLVGAQSGNHRATTTRATTRVAPTLGGTV